MDWKSIRADLDLTTLIYMIAVVLWVVGNLFSKKNKKGQPGRVPGSPRPRPHESEGEAELREFLERMTGQRAEIEEEEYEEEVEELPPRRAAPVQRQPAPRYVPPAPAAAPIADLTAMADQVAGLKRQKSAAMGKAFSSALRSTGSQFKLTEANISILRTAMRSSHPRPSTPVVRRNDLSNKRMFRKVMAARIVLGTPRAFETDDVPEAIRH